MPAPEVNRQSKATLLVVEADERVREGLVRAFEEEGCAVVACADASAALRATRDARFDLAVVDAELPGVDGLALCRLLRAQDPSERMPVVVSSTRGDEGHRVEAFAAGADDFVLKSASSRELLTRVRAHLEAAARRRALEGTNRELAFLADLGRGLLHAMTPAEVVRRVAGAAYEGANAATCAAVLTGDGAGKQAANSSAVICVFDREGSAEEDAGLIDLG